MAAIMTIITKTCIGEESGVCYRGEDDEVIPEARGKFECAQLGGDRWEVLESNEFGDWTANPNKDCYIRRMTRIIEGFPPLEDYRIDCNRVEGGSAAFTSEGASGTSGITRAKVVKRPPIGRRCTGPKRRWIRKGGRLRCSPWPPRKRNSNSGGFHFSDN